MSATPNDILRFWRLAGPKKWFNQETAFDEAIRQQFEPTHQAAARGEYDAWGETPDGALALVIVLDQFPRNLYRRSAHAFATDAKALAVARVALAAGWRDHVDPALDRFFILPFEHSENVTDQDASLALAKETGDTNLVKWAEIHRDIILRFGRFPHRNLLFGRTATPEEQEFLDGGGFAG